MSVKRIRNVVVVAVGLMAVSTPGAQTPPMPQQQMTDLMKMSPERAKKCQAMMADHDNMTAGMKAADQKLDGLVTKMNSAIGG